MPTYKIKVRRSPLSGLNSKGQRLNIVSGIYEVEHENIHLIFKNADNINGGNITVLITDYPELGEFPDVGPHNQIEIM